MIARLTDDHARIRIIAADLLGYLDAPRAPLVPGFARRRWELMRELSQHLACERRVLGSVHGIDDTLDRALREHMLEWTATAIQDRWLVYRQAARRLLRRLDQRMAHEERTVFSLLPA